MEEDMLDTAVYRCSKCLSRNNDVHVPCVVVMGVGDIPDSCLFSHGGDDAEWEQMS